LVAGRAPTSEPGLVGYWKLQGDCKDYSGHGHHGKNHHVNLETSEFNGRESYIEVPENGLSRHFAFSVFPAKHFRKLRRSP